MESKAKEEKEAKMVNDFYQSSNSRLRDLMSDMHGGGDKTSSP